MKSSIAVVLLSLFLIPVGRSLAQQSPDPMQANLIAYAHFKVLTPPELNQLSSKAQSGDAEAQYWMGVLNAEGTVPKGIRRQLKVAILTPKLNWDTNTSTAKALNRALRSLPNGIEERQSTFQT